MPSTDAPTDATATVSADALYSPLVEQAIELASQWHDRTYRKGRWREPAFAVPTTESLKVPVVAHVTTVALTVQRAGWPDEVVAAAFLHDIIEDGNRHGENFRYDELATLLGTEVADLVQDVTEQKQDETGAWRSWQDRKRDYVAHLEAEASVGAVAISLADKLHNLWSINETLASGVDVFTSTENRRALSAGPEDQHWFHRAVLRASETHDDPRLTPMRERLAREIERFEELTDQGTGASAA